MANFEGFCPVRNILSQIGDKWSVLAMVAIQKYGVCRFRDFQKDMPDVSRKMLSQTLKRLEDYTPGGLSAGHPHGLRGSPAKGRVQFDRTGRIFPASLERYY